MNGTLSTILNDLLWAGDLATFKLLRSRRRDTTMVEILPHQVTVRFNGKRIPIHVRPTTMDLEIARLILCRHSEYEVPVQFSPKVIFDVGANIGMTSLYFAECYPDARIFAFEPLPQNLDLLRANLKSLGDRATIIPCGLGAEEGVFEYHPSNDPTNFGGGTFHNTGCDKSQSIELPVKTAASICEEHNIDQIDLLKLDAEGAEYAVLQGLPDGILSNTAVVIGELHGVHDFEVLSLLDQTHHLQIEKALNRKCYPFLAVNRNRANNGTATTTAA